MNRWLIIVGVLALSALAGCFPEKRVVWSPDGRRALVRGGDDGLYVCDAAGRLSARLAADVGDIAWLPDSRHIVVSRMTTLSTWDALSKAVSPEHLKQLQQLGEKLREEVVAHEGDWDDFEPRTLEGVSDGEAAAALLYLRDRRSAGLAEKIGDKWDELRNVEAHVCLLHTAEIADGGLKEGPVIARSYDPIGSLRVAPGGRAIAYGATSTIGATMLPEPPKYDTDRQSIYVVPTDGSGPPREVARRTTMHCDWSPDGRYLAYLAASAPLAGERDAMQLGVVARRQVADASGALLAELPEAEELAGLLFDEMGGPRYLPDGRIVFPSIEVHLPCTSADMPERGGLFSVDPGRQATVTRLIPKSAQDEVPEATALFEPSPDGRHIAIADTDGWIVMLDVAAGDVWEVLEAGEVDNLRTLPAWRSADELSFVFVPGPEEAKGRPQLVLGKVDWPNHDVERQPLSADWPDEVVLGMLVKKPDEQPTSQPATKPAADSTQRAPGSQ